MSAKSRGRHRLDPPAATSVTAEERQQLDDVVDAFELAEVNPRGGIGKFVSAVFSARDRAQQPDVEPEDPAEHMPENMPATPQALREPTPFERAILGGMARKPMYGGTVEPWRVDERRRRNRAARKARRANRQAARR